MASNCGNFRTYVVCKQYGLYAFFRPILWAILGIHIYKTTIPPGNITSIREYLEALGENLMTLSHLGAYPPLYSK